MGTNLTGHGINDGEDLAMNMRKPGN